MKLHSCKVTISFTNDYLHEMFAWNLKIESPTKNVKSTILFAWNSIFSTPENYSYTYISQSPTFRRTESLAKCLSTLFLDSTAHLHSDPLRNASWSDLYHHTFYSNYSSAYMLELEACIDDYNVLGMDDRRMCGTIMRDTLCAWTQTIAKRYSV